MPAEAWLRWAEWVGGHALPLFLAALAGQLLLVAALWRALRGRWRPGAGAELPRVGAVLLAGGAGLAIVLALAWLFAGIAGRLAPQQTLAMADQALSAAVGREVGASALQAFALLTHLGDPGLMWLIGTGVALLLWRRRERVLAAGWVMAVGGNGLLNPTLKRVFERLRPPHDQGLVSASGWSFPSGHSSGAMVAYGMLAYLALRLLAPVWQLPALLAAAALVFTVGCSRIFLQVHFASDVVGGFASGAAWLLVCIASVEFALQLRRRR